MRPNAFGKLCASLLLAATAACATAAPPPRTPQISFEQKMAWMLQLEDRRVLKIELPPPVVTPPARGRRAAPLLPPPASSPDLFLLIKDAEPRVRRRAALSIGRVGLPDGIPALAGALSDADPEVRQMAAFALGLIGVALDDGSEDAAPALAPALTPLTAALADADVRVRGRAAEALGQIKARSAAPPIGKLAADLVRTPAVMAMQPDEEKWPGAAEADAFRLAVFALVRLRAYEPLASAVAADGRPLTTWWPVAYALQRIDDKRAQPALLRLLHAQGKYSRAFAARGLGALRAPEAVDALLPLLDPSRAPLEVVVSAVRAAGQIGDSRAVAPLVALASDPAVDANVRLEAVAALGQQRSGDAVPVLQDLMTDPWPAMRAGALRAVAASDQENFSMVLAGLDADRHWIVRAALADVLATLPPETALDRVRAMLQDEDKRVLPSVLNALARLKAPDAGPLALKALAEPDFALRAAAARIVGQLKPAGGAEALRTAYKAGQPDSAYDARAAALAALAEFGAAEAAETIRAALADKDWAVRIRAAQLLARLEPAADHRAAIRPVPGSAVAPYDHPQIISPAFSPHVFIETAKGTIEFELSVLDAPLTSQNFVGLARRGFFNGLQIHRVVPNFVVQDGDSRGDGEGGPGYTIRDELNDRPYLRGTVGMALAGRDTGGSQFFITHSPQPHLDGRYTVFGHVVNGMDVVDRIQQGDVIQRVRVWDGKGWE